MVMIDVGDGCSGSHVLPARDDRPAKEATGAFVFPQQFLNQRSQRRVSAARVVEKSLPCCRLQLERVCEQSLRGLSRLIHEYPVNEWGT
jgi:hypothetical protein